ncbi:MAG: molybdopterin-dependent oxidoreductase [Candidatus Acidiferrales bacterium]
MARLRKANLATLSMLFASFFSLGAHSQDATKKAALVVTGDITTPLSLSLADLKNLPRKTLNVTNPHEKEKESYEGVPLLEILKKAGVPVGPQLRGAAMATYIEAGASDGYRVIFSLPELDPDFEDSDVLVADTLNGAPMGDELGPLRLVAPHEKRPARWIRQLTTLRVVRIPARASPATPKN